MADYATTSSGLPFSAYSAETVKEFLRETRVIFSAKSAHFDRVMATRSRSPTPPRRPRRQKKRVGRPAKESLLSALRESRGLNQDDVADYLGRTSDSFGKIERGETGLKAQDAAALAALYKVEIAELLGATSRAVPIRGIVGAGALVYPIDDGGAAREVECPTGMEPGSTAALEVRGDSMFPLLSDGWVVFYAAPKGNVPHDAIGQTCVVQVADEGPLLLKHVRAGYSPGRFNLLSANAAPIEDAALEWAAPVRAYTSPALARIRDVSA